MAAPYAGRLFVLDKNLRHTMRHLASPQDLEVTLPMVQWLHLFRIALACFAFHTGSEIDSSRLFLTHAGEDPET